MEFLGKHVHCYHCCNHLIYIGYSGDGGLAVNAQLHNPTGITLNSIGEILFVDSLNGRIRKIDGNGIITTIAGGGNGVGNLAINANLANPYGIAVNSIGEIFLTEAAKVRKILTNGQIITIAGTITTGFSGDGGLATNALLSSPYGIAINSIGEIYISDTYNYRIRKIFTNGTITTIAGTGAQGFSGDGGLAINAMLDTPLAISISLGGEIYFSDAGFSKCIRKIDRYGIITTVASGFYYPIAVAVSSTGEFFIADSIKSTIYKVDVNGITTAIAGNGNNGYSGDGGLATYAKLYYPIALTISKNEIYVADYNNNLVRKLTPISNCNCGANGQCNTATNTCTCNSGWSGAQCNQAVCSPTCGVNATCTAPNTCTCNSGSLCNQPICSPACSTNATCTATNTCTCNSGWSGSQCNQPICSPACGVNATCTAPNVCKCNQGSTCIVLSNAPERQFNIMLQCLVLILLIVLCNMN